MKIQLFGLFLLIAPALAAQKGFSFDISFFSEKQASCYVMTHRGKAFSEAEAARFTEAFGGKSPSASAFLKVGDSGNLDVKMHYDYTKPLADSSSQVPFHTEYLYLIYLPPLPDAATADYARTVFRAYHYQALVLRYAQLYELNILSAEDVRQLFPDFDPRWHTALSHRQWTSAVLASPSYLEATRQALLAANPKLPQEAAKALAAWGAPDSPALRAWLADIGGAAASAQWIERAQQPAPEDDIWETCPR